MIVAIEIEAHNGTGIETLRYFSGRDPLTFMSGGVLLHFAPGLTVPITFGSTINGEQYGATIRGAPNGGDVVFDAQQSDYYRLAYGYHFTGHKVRVYSGDLDESYSGLELQYSGRIADLKMPFDGVIRAQVSTTDESFSFDNPLVGELYPDTETIEDVRGKPRPEVYGTVKGFQPVLLDNANQVYQVSRVPLVAVDAVRVGGILWTQAAADASGAVIPRASQWSADLAAGTIKLGSTTLGQEVRVDARGTPVTTASLMTRFIQEGGGVVDTASMAELEATAPYQIGWATRLDPVNMLNALDEIMAAVGGYWSFNERGLFTAGVLAAPAVTEEHTVDDVSIQGLTLTGLLPPAWRIQVEHSRNWEPLTNVLPGATDAEKQAAAATGKIAPAYKNEEIKVVEPRAVDVPVIRSLVATEADAIAIRDRLSAAWGVSRRVYDVRAWTLCPQLYDTVRLNYRGVIDLNMRVHSVLRSVGGNPTQMRLWGP